MQARERPEAHSHPHAQFGRQLDHGGDERPPLEVGLGPDQVKDVLPVEVVAATQLEHGPGEALRHAVHDARHRPAGALVDQRLTVEGGDELGRCRGEQCGDGSGRSETGVDPALEGDDEDRMVEAALVECRS